MSENLQAIEHGSGRDEMRTTRTQPRPRVVASRRTARPDSSVPPVERWQHSSHLVVHKVMARRTFA
jgi:hypothetical protein